MNLPARRSDPRRVYGTTADGKVPSVLRMTAVIKHLREQGQQDAIAVVLDLHRKVGNRCPEHGEIADPIVTISTLRGERELAFGCPWCSSPDVLEAWEREGDEQVKRTEGQGTSR
ncbi:MAG: hypothetical protein ACYDDA_05210 [Acidiferrobacteraceae bacterium]